MWICAGGGQEAGIWPEMPIDAAREQAQSASVMDGSNTGSVAAPRTRLRLGACVGALMMVALSTAVGLLIAPRWGSAPVVLLYLPPVLGAAVLYGLWPALVAAIGSTLAYNFFFTAPYRTLVIHSPADLVTVVMLFVVAVVTSQLASSMREQARLARAHAARNATIAGLARRLLACTGDQAIAEVAVGSLSQLFGCNAVLLVGPDNPQLLGSAPANMVLPLGDIAAAAMALETGDAAGRGLRHDSLADWQFHPVLSNQGVMATVGLARDDGLPPVPEDQLALLGNLLDQVALALERARLEAEARNFVALRERDNLRSALLDSIVEDVRPRLTAITSAGRALKRDRTSDNALAATVVEETAKLERYIDNLVDLSSGSAQEPITVGPVTIDLYQRLVTKDGERVHLTPKEYAVLAELARNAGRVLPHAYLLRSVWGPAQEGQIDYLRVTVRALRQKLERTPAQPELIVNVPAIGYGLFAA